MAEHVGVGGAWKAITGQWVGVGGAWKLVTQKWIGVGGVWKLAYSALTAVISDVTKNQIGSGASGNVTSDAASIVTPSGGSGSYTYSYTLNSVTSGPTPSISSGGTTGSPRFQALSVSDGTPSVSTWTGTITDSTYGNSVQDTFTVTLRWITV